MALSRVAAPLSLTAVGGPGALLRLGGQTRRAGWVAVFLVTANVVSGLPGLGVTTWAVAAIGAVHT